MTILPIDPYAKPHRDFFGALRADLTLRGQIVTRPLPGSLIPGASTDQLVDVQCILLTAAGASVAEVTRHTLRMLRDAVLESTTAGASTQERATVALPQPMFDWAARLAYHVALCAGRDRFHSLQAEFYLPDLSGTLTPVVAQVVTRDPAVLRATVDHINLASARVAMAAIPRGPDGLGVAARTESARAGEFDVARMLSAFRPPTERK